MFSRGEKLYYRYAVVLLCLQHSFIAPVGAVVLPQSGSYIAAWMQLYCTVGAVIFLAEREAILPLRGSFIVPSAQFYCACGLSCLLEKKKSAENVSADFFTVSFFLIVVREEINILLIVPHSDIRA